MNCPSRAMKRLPRFIIQLCRASHKIYIHLWVFLTLPIKSPWHLIRSQRYPVRFAEYFLTDQKQKLPRRKQTAKLLKYTLGVQETALQVWRQPPQHSIACSVTSLFENRIADHLISATASDQGVSSGRTTNASEQPPVATPATGQRNTQGHQPQAGGRDDNGKEPRCRSTSSLPLIPS